MYCPQCAAQNADGAKFCRTCGLKLEAVALVLSEEAKPQVKEKNKKDEAEAPLTWMELRIKGIKGVTGGSILLAISLLIGVAMALFVPHEVPWMLVWIVFFGWMACWGGIELANGIGSLLEAKGRLWMGEPAIKETITDPAPQESLPAGEPQTIMDARALRLSPSLSVTESTTRELDKQLKD
jgi:hypothetical protein